MNPLNQAVFFLLVLEVFVVLFLTAPLPSALRGAIIRWVGNSHLLGSLSRPLLYFAVVVLLFFLHTVKEMLALQTEHSEQSNTVDLSVKLRVEARMFRSQRNFYLCGFCVLLLFVIRNLYQLLKQINRISASEEAMKKQATQLKVAYDALSAENDKLKVGGKSSEADEADKLRIANKELKAERDAAVKSSDALKKQAEGLSAEYQRLGKEKESLENRLADFELVMGADVKKAK